MKQVDSTIVEDETILTNEKGGKQSYIKGRWDLFPYAAMSAVAEVLKHGAEKYSVNNWRNIPTEEHVSHALKHSIAFTEEYHCSTGKRDAREELAHAACRILFALTTLIEEEK